MEYVFFQKAYMYLYLRATFDFNASRRMSLPIDSVREGRLHELSLACQLTVANVRYIVGDAHLHKLSLAYQTVGDGCLHEYRSSVSLLSLACQLTNACALDRRRWSSIRIVARVLTVARVLPSLCVARITSKFVYLVNSKVTGRHVSSLTNAAMSMKIGRVVCVLANRAFVAPQLYTVCVVNKSTICTSLYQVLQVLLKQDVVD